MVPKILVETNFGCSGIVAARDLSIGVEATTSSGRYLN